MSELINQATGSELSVNPPGSIDTLNGCSMMTQDSFTSSFATTVKSRATATTRQPQRLWFKWENTHTFCQILQKYLLVFKFNEEIELLIDGKKHQFPSVSPSVVQKQAIIQSRVILQQLLVSEEYYCYHPLLWCEAMATLMALAYLLWFPKCTITVASENGDVEWINLKFMPSLLKQSCPILIHNCNGLRGQFRGFGGSGTIMLTHILGFYQAIQLIELRI